MPDGAGPLGGERRLELGKRQPRARVGRVPLEVLFVQRADAVVLGVCLFVWVCEGRVGVVL